MREELLTKLIRCFGFEHPYVITFAHMMERRDIDDNSLQMLYDSIMVVTQG